MERDRNTAMGIGSNTNAAETITIHIVSLSNLLHPLSPLLLITETPSQGELYIIYNLGLAIVSNLFHKPLAPLST